MSFIFIYKAGEGPEREPSGLIQAGALGIAPAEATAWICGKVGQFRGKEFFHISLSKGAAYGFLSDSCAHHYIKALVANQYRAYQGYKDKKKLGGKEELGMDLLAGAIFACCFQISLKAWNRQLPSWKDLGKTASYGVATRVVAHLFQVVADLF